ncbi:RNA polymerase sigma factor [Aureliella helgolandensis]|uniref:RNA polymerase sigma factor n=1 Tax=Aureliella helgolandensis TaxID=2527968 RepID=A0A518GHD0_9BACT|nr:sigma-70 family RNA polymerase sigma factor [Aureliella helgolandensis]QDV27996.1 RNA polymerase sigma factor [Aureliella helgolandensis]
MSRTPAEPDAFETTQWSTVLAAGDVAAARHGDALAELCQRYWRPLYGFICHRGKSPDSAEDLIQAFFVQLLDGPALRIADPSRGRFRTFLLTSLTNFLHNQRDHNMALKRGGAVRLLSLDIRNAEGELINQPMQFASAEDEFQRQWAITVMDEALSRTEATYRRRGKAHLFQLLSASLSVSGTERTYAETATLLGMSESAVKVAVHRLRKEYRLQLRESVASTVESTGDVQDELETLLSALRPTRDR